jgi:hypothetical protein
MHGTDAVQEVLPPSLLDAFPEAYGWRSIPETDLPTLVFDVDGTLRGDVLPMVRLARPLVPKYLRKVTLREPFNLRKLLQFSWNLARLWTLRTIHSEHRRRYKHLFSELHNLAGALFQGMTVDAVREKYRERLKHMHGLWWQDAVELLRRTTSRSNVVLVTGSEQVQTEECVRLLADQGVWIDRVFIRGSLYGFDPDDRRFTGGIQHLNVTLDAKRDAVRSLQASPNCRCHGAMGNSRPDRALFESVDSDGLCVLVCAPAVFRKRTERTFVIRKFHRSGYRVYWETSDFLAAMEEYQACAGTAANAERPILATDPDFQNMLQCDALQARFPVLQP